MANKPRLPTKFSSNPPFSDGDGSHIHNTILLGLPPKESQTLKSELECR